MQFPHPFHTMPYGGFSYGYQYMPVRNCLASGQYCATVLLSVNFAVNNARGHEAWRQNGVAGGVGRMALRVCEFVLTYGVAGLRICPNLFIDSSIAQPALPQPSYGSMPAGSDHYQNHQPGYSIPPSRGANNAVNGPRAQRGDGRKERDVPDVHVPRGPVPPMAFTAQPVGQYPFDIANGMRNLQVSHDKIVPNSQNRTNTGAKVRLGMKTVMRS